MNMNKRTYVAFVTNEQTGRRYGMVTVIAANRREASRKVCVHLIDSGFTEPGTTFDLKRLHFGLLSCLWIPS